MSLLTVLLTLIIAVLVFALLWVLIDLLTGLLPDSNPPTRLKPTVNILFKALLILVAVLWLIQTFLGGLPGIK